MRGQAATHRRHEMGNAALPEYGTAVPPGSGACYRVSTALKKVRKKLDTTVALNPDRDRPSDGGALAPTDRNETAA